jgi:FKBP-type peptidyl-prolyl cis-trans isomerase SlpA
MRRAGPVEGTSLRAAGRRSWFFYNQASLSGLALASNARRIRPGSFLTLHYRLAVPQGDIINTFGGQPATLTLGAGELSPAVEERLLGLAEGDHLVFELAAGEAFGERNPHLRHWVARSLLDQTGNAGTSYQVGDVVQFPTPDGVGRYAGSVQQVGGAGADAGEGDAVLFDFNHPLAGQPVTFEVRLIGVL